MSQIVDNSKHGTQRCLVVQALTGSVGLCWGQIKAQKKANMTNVMTAIIQGVYIFCSVVGTKIPESELRGVADRLEAWALLEQKLKKSWMWEESNSLHEPLESSRSMEWMTRGSNLWQQSTLTWRQTDEIRRGLMWNLISRWISTETGWHTVCNEKQKTSVSSLDTVFATEAELHSGPLRCPARLYTEPSARPCDCLSGESRTPGFPASS